MSKYTTGEIAKICGVTVRTVQYYDDRGILVPSEISDGGRRLYNDEDLNKLHIICFLREIGLSINHISILLKEENTKNVISTFLEQQEKVLSQEIREKEDKLILINKIKKELKDIKEFSIESISDIANITDQKNKIKRFRILLVVLSIPFSILQWVAIILWIKNGFWQLFVLWVCLDIPFAFFISKFYMRYTKYICPECHIVFKPSFKESYFAYHTPRMRRLTCPKCNRKSLCVEIYNEKEDK